MTSTHLHVIQELAYQLAFAVRNAWDEELGSFINLIIFFHLEITSLECVSDKKAP